MNIPHHEDLPQSESTLLASARSLHERLLSARDPVACSAAEKGDLHTVHRLLIESRAIVGERINSSQPINKLPTEVLCYIFSLVLDEIPFRGKAVPKVLPTFMQNIRQYRPLLLACRHWHRLINNTPSFWSTFIDETAPDGATSLYTHYIARCPTGPACVVVPAGATEEMHTLSIDEEFGSRVKQLSHACKPGVACGATGGEYNHILYHSFPELDTCIVALHYCPTDSRVYYPACRILPDSIRLRYLSLYDTNFLPITSFPALVALRLQGATLDPRFEALLWKCLSNCPALQVLELTNVWVEHATPVQLSDLEPCPHDKVALNSLRALVLIRDDFKNEDGQILQPVVEFVRWFKDHAVLSSKCDLCVAFLPFEDLELFHEAFDISGFGDMVTISLEMVQPSGHCLLSLDIRTTSDVRVVLGICDSIIPTPIEPGWDIRRIGHMEIARADDTHQSRAKLCTWLSTSPVLRTIRRLFLNAEAAWALVQPSSILLALPDLNVLATSLPTIPAAELPIFVKHMLDTLMPGADGTLVCPTLATLVIDYATVSPDGTVFCDAALYAWNAPYHVCQKITALARARGSLGHAINRFYVFYRTPAQGRRGDPPGEPSDGNLQDSKLLLDEYDATASLLRTLDDVAANKLREKLWDFSWL
ncbi:hypothetical protein GY45DRAFT_1327606 [Cubamyces sp. BRFM 1775]|nr:hypothetical protein GY45DRAFT_1327606 [Cubamyces sp. BRFM 1775]